MMRRLRGTIVAGALLVGSAASASQSATPIHGNSLTTVTSRDGTRIGVECAGAGPTLLFVHGGLGDRTRWTPMFPLLASRFTACAMDRRGRGTSGDAPDYNLAKEAEDIVAVVNARPGPVYVFGHSYGAVAAIEAALQTDRIAKLMLYEPPLHDPAAPNLALATIVEDLVKQGRPGEAVVRFQSEIIKLSDQEIERLKAGPSWNTLVATIGVHPRQMRALSAYHFDPDRIRALKVPTLLVRGEETASPYLKQSIDALRGSLPHPTVVVLERQEHNAMDSGRAALATAIINFLTTSQ
jgi:pimeloyl-ACP methyl ester carboxylesterase